MPRDAPASTLEDVVHLPHGVRLALRRTPGHRRPFLLVHGLASNARMWDGVTAALAEQGHEVVAVDLRGHGRSPDTDGGYDTATAASDLASLLTVLGWTGDRQPVVAGQSWGGNVVLHLAATSGGVGALALVDGGWIRPAERFPDEDACSEALAPPRTGRHDAGRSRRPRRGLDRRLARHGACRRARQLRREADGTVRARLLREHHRSILSSLWRADPRTLYPLVPVPVALLAAGQEAGGTSAEDAAKVAAVQEAASELSDATVRWFPGAHHDVHAQRPGDVARELLVLEGRIASRA